MKNVSQLILDQTKKYPDKIAVSYKRKKYNFIEFNNRINVFVNRLQNLGVRAQDKVLFFVRPNLDFAAITFSLFRLGAVPVFIDPGMKREYFLKAIKEVNPDVLLGVPKVQLLAKIKKEYFTRVRLFVQVGGIPWLGKSLYFGLDKSRITADIYQPKEDDLAAILYTSGGTGAPKGVEYSHDIFINQTRMLKDVFNLDHNDIDIPGFPLFSFFSLALGMRSHVPNIDVSKPASCNPKKLYQDIVFSQATFLAGSPSIWDRLADYCLENELKLDHVKAVALFGAAVDLKLHEKFKQILPNGTTFTPYGATECLPISCISGREILLQHRRNISEGRGICVGRPLSGVQVKILKTTSDKIDHIADQLVCEYNEVGEIVVSSPNVTKGYYQNSNSTEMAKIVSDGILWHRMGDLGYIDQDNFLWYCGRKSHAVSWRGDTFYPAQVETIFNQHPRVKRSALIQDRKTGKPIVVVQKFDGGTEIETMFLMDLKNLAQSFDVTKKIQDFRAINVLPVDVRHNIKIDRLALATEVSL